jgi:hypothetical protein
MGTAKYMQLQVTLLGLQSSDRSSQSALDQLTGMTKHPRSDNVMCLVLQDIRTAMALLSAMPSINLELWAQLSRAAGRQHHWQLALQCASAALGALPADKRELTAISSPADVPHVTAQGWFWLSVAEMQRGQVRHEG